jgi:hypothetical protein
MRFPFQKRTNHLGQTNFFMEFDVLFSRAALYFELYKKGTFDRKY